MPMALWRILLKAQAQPDVDLTCDECLAILNYLAEEEVDGASRESVRQAAYKHLARCPGCREHYLHWLRQLEAGRALGHNDREG
jgi:uncharacterized protein with PIN domain